MIDTILNLDTKLLKDFVSEEDFKNQEPFFTFFHKLLTENKGKGAQFTGWLKLPSENLGNKTLLSQIQSLKNDLSKIKYDTIVVIGIGGSYMGTKAIYEAFRNPFNNQPYKEIIFAGHHLESTYYNDLIESLKEKSFITIVISKSGTTTEPAIAFRLIRHLMLSKYTEEEMRERTLVITDEEKGALRKLANSELFESFIVPDNVGGRFSIFTPVGLVPLALAGFDIEKILDGAKIMEKHCIENDSIEKNIALRYAAARHLLLRRGKPMEVLSSFYPSLNYLAEWWKQLFGESEGKENKGIFPVSMMFTTDLHSLGQYVQEGMRIFFETIISIDEVDEKIIVPISTNNDDELEYLENRALSQINKQAELATSLAHYQGKVPVISLRLKRKDLFHLGALLYFFEFSCAISAYCFEVNPFDQPGVEAYKNNMYALLGKPGYEELRKKLNVIEEK